MAWATNRLFFGEAELLLGLLLAGEAIFLGLPHKLASLLCLGLIEHLLHLLLSRTNLTKRFAALFPRSLRLAPLSINLALLFRVEKVASLLLLLLDLPLGLSSEWST